MKKYLSIVLAVVVVLSLVTYGAASQVQSTDVTLTVGSDSEGEDPGGVTMPDDGDNSPGEDTNPGSGSGTTPEGSKPSGDSASKPGSGSGSGGGGHGGSSSGGSSSSNSSSGGSSNSGGSGSGENSSSETSSMKPNGDKSGGVDSKGNPYYLLEGVHVADGIHEDGYMYGYSGLMFGSDKYLTRGQFAVIMDRVFEFDGKGTEKTFEDTRGHWTEESVNRLAAHGVIYGVSSSEFRPNSGLTRGHVLLMLSRVLDIAQYSKVTNLSSVSKYHAKETIAQMLNSGIYDEINSDFDVSAWITRGEMVHLLNNLIYGRNAKAIWTERVLDTYQVFQDLTQNRSHAYFDDCVKSLNYSWLVKEVSNFEK